jgi:hypothetical protein
MIVEDDAGESQVAGAFEGEIFSVSRIIPWD